MMIRQATTDDAAAIAEVHVAAWHETYAGLIPQEILDGLSVSQRTRGWSQTLSECAAEESDQRVFVAEDGDRIVGFASGGPNRLEEYPHTGEVQSIYLLREVQRRGIGKALFRSVVEFLHSQSHETYLVRVLVSNTPTVRFYEAQGGTWLAEYDEVLKGHPLPHAVYGYGR